MRNDRKKTAKFGELDDVRASQELQNKIPLVTPDFKQKQIKFNFAEQSSKQTLEKEKGEKETTSKSFAAKYSSKESSSDDGSSYDIGNVASS